jgi:acyl-CoA synthetase (AMP-forming)/AMP-acid ligase II
MATRAPTASACIAAPGGEDGRSGYCEATRTFRSLRPPVPLPPKDAPLSFTAFAFSLLPPFPSPEHPAFLDAATGEAVSFPAFRRQVRALAGALRSRLGLRRGDVAFVLAPARLDVPVLYFALLSFGAVVSPANPALNAAEVARLVALSEASVAFAVSSTAAKVPAGLPTVLLDSDQFRSFLRLEGGGEGLAPETMAVRQSDTAAIQYSSGTTGRVKAAALSHRNFIAMAAGSHALSPKPRHGCDRMLLSAPMFHSLGFYFALKAVALGQTTVLVTDAVARRGVKGVVEAAERWAVTEMTASPPVVMAMAKEPCVLQALERVVCGGAPLPTSAAERFRRRFPNVDLCMVSFHHVAFLSLLLPL